MIRSFQFNAAPFLPPMGTEQIMQLSYIPTLRKTHAAHMHPNIEPFNRVKVNNHTMSSKQNKKSIKIKVDF